MSNLIELSVDTGRSVVGPMINLHEVNEFVNLVEQAYREEEQEEFIYLYFDLQFCIKNTENKRKFELRNPDYPMISKDDNSLYESFMHAVDDLDPEDSSDPDYDAYVIDVANQLRTAHYDYGSYKPLFEPTLPDIKVKSIAIDTGSQKLCFNVFSEADVFVKNIAISPPQRVLFIVTFVDGTGHEFLYKLNYVLTPPDMKYFSSYVLLRSYSDMLRHIYNRFAEKALIWFSEEQIGALSASFFNWDLVNMSE